MITSIDNLAEILRRFTSEREGERYHSPKNLAMAMNVEAGELMEHFQWLTEEESFLLCGTAREAVRQEPADVWIYLVQLADWLDIGLLTAAEEKMVRNAEKYPAGAKSGNV